MGRERNREEKLSDRLSGEINLRDAFVDDASDGLAAEGDEDDLAGEELFL